MRFWLRARKAPSVRVAASRLHLDEVTFPTALVSIYPPEINFSTAASDVQFFLAAFEVRV